MYHNLSEVLTTLKENIGIADMPLPVTDQEIVDRLRRSSMREFSVRSPFIGDFIIGTADAMNLTSQSVDGSVTYRIPKEVYEERDILQILHIDPGRTGGYSDYYVPTGAFNSPDFVLETIADIKLAAQLGAMVSHAPTFRFIPPNNLTVWNGWSGGNYKVTAAFSHSMDFSTFSTGQFTHYMQLAELDLEWYLYGKLKRKDQLDTGVGSISMKIDDWAQAGERFRELLKEWDDNGASLDIEPVTWF